MGEFLDVAYFERPGCPVPQQLFGVAAAAEWRLHAPRPFARWAIGREQEDGYRSSLNGPRWLSSTRSLPRVCWLF